MSEIQLRLPDGSERSVAQGVVLGDMAADLIDKPKRLLGALVDGTLVDLHTPLTEGGEVRPVTAKDPEGLFLIRHSAAHIMADSVQRLFPDVQITIGPAIDNGFYYDFAMDGTFSEEDLAKIEKQMNLIMRENLPFRREEIAKEDAIALFKEMGEEFKIQIIEDLESDTVSLYKHGEFVDLCRGPHVPSTGQIKAVKLLTSSGAYWRGDERNPMLQRIYGTAFDDKKALKRHLNALAEAKKRDHRRVGKDLDLFSFSNKVGAGLTLWHPKGARVRLLIEDHWRKAHLEGGYEVVYTPHVGRSTLWETSGHLDFFTENMFAPMEIEGQSYYAKPMNCPFHIQMFANKRRSYRELPIRWAELGTVYRYERTGVLHGLMRVRGMTQDDAHIFCTPDQVEEEISRVLGFVLEMLQTFGFEDFDVYLSTRPEKAVGDDSDWEMATDALRRAVEANGLTYQIKEGEGAFYGPKIDIDIKDALGRAWQCSTIQFDFNLPRRFDLSFIGDDGQEHRPFMVHRALLGTIERFFGVLLEHYAGRFPLWLAPIQAEVLNITDNQADYVVEVANKLKAAGIRAEADLRNEKLGRKIRDAQLQKVPYMLVVGDREMEGGTVALRDRTGKDYGPVSLDDLIERLNNEIEERGGPA